MGIVPVSRKAKDRLPAVSVYSTTLVELLPVLCQS